MSRAVRYPGEVVCAHVLQRRCAHDRCRMPIAPRSPDALFCNRCALDVAEFIRENWIEGTLLYWVYQRTSDGGYLFEWRREKEGAA